MPNHAYLILAHKNYGQLKKLIKLLASKHSAIYLSLDKKFKLEKEQIKALRQMPGVKYVQRHRANWGSAKLSLTTVKLLAAARADEHDYYHFISGQDLPIKSQQEIQDFFAAHPHTEFLQFNDREQAEHFRARMQYYYPFQEICGRSNNIFLRALNEIQNGPLLKLQQFCKVDRLKGINFSAKGPNWFSITKDFADAILARQKEIRKHCKFTSCSDEHFMQYLAILTGFDKKCANFSAKEANNNLRLIDWERGKPYTFRESDYDELMTNPNFFARKFDEEVDSKIVDRIYQTILKKQNDEK